MSDADDQLGGTGGDRGKPPDEVRPGQDNAAPVGPDDRQKRGDEDPAARKNEQKSQ